MSHRRTPAALPTTLTRRRFHGSLLAGAWLARSSRAGVDASPTLPFPIGTHVYREPHRPFEELRGDFATLARLGFTVVKLQESWALDEQVEGKVDLSTTTALVAEARRQGLGVFYGVTMEQAPGWLWRKYPDARPVYESGQRWLGTTQYLLPSDGKPGPCWHHAGARGAAVRFLQAVVKAVSAYDNVRVWNVWQEVDWGQPAQANGDRGFCYCPNSLAAFRRWLQERYRTVARLDAAWSTGYGDWDEIEPPRGFRTVPAMIDWRTFTETVTFQQALRWKASVFRQGDARRRPVMAHVAATTVGSTANFVEARELDVFGSSMYPGWQGRLWQTPFLNFDYARAAARGRTLWGAEMQGGPLSDGTTIRAEPDAEDIRRWMLGLLATGAQGMCFWNHRPEIFWGEAYGFGLLDAAGKETERARAAGRIARALRARTSFWTAEPQDRPSVGMLVGDRLYHFIDNMAPEARRAYVDGMKGQYRALLESGVAVDFVDVAAGPLDPGRHRGLLLPLPLSLGGDDIDRLRAYVDGGGTLISTACPGRFDDRCLAAGGGTGMMPALEPVFGARHLRLEMVKPPAERAKVDERNRRDSVDDAPLVGEGTAAGMKLTPAFYLQSLTPTQGTPLFRRGGDVTGVEHAFGRGRAYLIGTVLGFGAAADGGTAPVLSALLARAGVRGDRVGRLVRRRRRAAGHDGVEAWFLINFARTEVTETVPLPPGTTAHDLVDEAAGAAAVAGRAGSVSVTVPPEAVRCLMVVRQGS